MAPIFLPKNTDWMCGAGVTAAYMPRGAVLP